MKLVISNVSGIPIYIQIKEQIISAILSGQLADDELLPSLRQLSKELQVSVLTTTRAYTELEQEGFITSLQGKGSYVTPKGSQRVKKQLETQADILIKEAVSLVKRAELSKDIILQMVDNWWEEKE